MAYTGQVEFEWDEGKSRANRIKHGISFEEARELFESGVDYLEVFDSAHSEYEDRFIAIGPISRGVIAVVWTEMHEEVVRIISARPATHREVRAFEMRSKR